MKNTPTGMGHGLAALLGESAVQEMQEEKIHSLPLEHLVPNPHQPRQHFSDESLQELATSIREQGILLPVLVRPLPKERDRFQLVAGERRWRAAQLAGLTEIPALIRNWSDRQALEAAILENVQREDLNPVEIARGCSELIDQFGYSHKKVAQRLGKSREAITNFLRLLRLPEGALLLLESGALSMGHARALLRLETQPEALSRLISEVLDKELTVRQTEELARSMALREEMRAETAAKPATGRGSRGRQRDPMIISIENRLAETLRTHVTITNLRGKGRVIVTYSTLEELELLAAHLLKEPPHAAR